MTNTATEAFRRPDCFCVRDENGETPLSELATGRILLHGTWGGVAKSADRHCPTCLGTGRRLDNPASLNSGASLGGTEGVQDITDAMESAGFTGTRWPLDHNFFNHGDVGKDSLAAARDKGRSSPVRERLSSCIQAAEAITPSETAKFLDSIRRALTKDVEQILSEEAEAAAQRCKERVQQKVGTIAMGMMEHCRAYFQGRDELHIVVKIAGPGTPR